MLWKWRRRNGSDATYLAIVTIFLQMNNRLLAEHVLETLSRETKTIAIDSCVNPGKVSWFENWEALNEVEKEKVRNTLFSKNEIIRTKFAYLSNEILCSLEERACAIEVDHLKIVFASFIGFQL